MSGKYALVIGNSQYDDPRLAQLTAPGRDAEDLAGMLRDRDFCAFDDVRVLLNQAEPVVREAIDEFFDEKRTEDLLVLYFSGHGVRDEQGALYLAVKNTNRSRLRSTAIKSDFIHEAMEQSRARRQVLILDCCNSGAVEQGTKAATGGSIGIANAFGGYGRVILTASDSLQYAWQGDAVIGNTDNSLFTHFLVEGLKGEAEVDGDGVITVDELYDYVYEQVKLSTPNQTPSKFATKQEGEIILRQITQLDQIKAAPLPAPLVESMENPLAAIRLGAIQELARLLKGKNLGLARSAREALESICAQDDSLSVRKAASEVLAPILAAEQETRAIAEQAQAESERLAAQKAEDERLAAAKREADRVALQKAEQGRLAAYRAEAERLAALQAQVDKQAQQKAAQEPARPAPWWIPTLWIALGFAISAALTVQLPANALENLILYGALSALTFGLALYLQRSLSQWTSIIWITIGGAAGWVIAGSYVYSLLDNGYSWSDAFSYRVAFSEAISGGLAGVVVAFVLIKEHAVHGWNVLYRIALAWASAGLVHGLTFQALYLGIFSPAGMSLVGPVAIGGALNGAIGGLATLWLIRTEGGQVGNAGQEIARAPVTLGQFLTNEQSVHPKWLAAVWVALALLVSAVVTIGYISNQVAAAVLCGALAGLAVALILRLEHTLARWMSILWITLGWTAGWTITGLYYQNLLNNGWSGGFDAGILLVQAVCGGIAGFVTALVLYRERAASSRDVLQWLALAWAFAGLMDGLFFQLLNIGVFSPAGLDWRYASYSGSAIDGAIIGLALVWLLRRANAPANATLSEPTASK